MQTQHKQKRGFGRFKIATQN